MLLNITHSAFPTPHSAFNMIPPLTTAPECPGTFDNLVADYLHLNNLLSAAQAADKISFGGVVLIEGTDDFLHIKGLLILSIKMRMEAINGILSNNK